MRIRRLSVEGFRNLAPQTLELHARTNVLVGDNGQGKTNLLEAAYLLAALRSFRTPRLAECVVFGGGGARVRGHIERRARTCDVEVAIGPAGRRVFVDGKTLRAPREYRGEVSAIVFVPEDLNLARGSPEGRRRFVDRAVFVTAPAHLADLLDYDRALRARNALLKDGIGRGPELDAHTAVLAHLGATILERRRAWTAAMEPVLARTFERVGVTARRAAIAYEARGDDLHGVSTRAQIEPRLVAALEGALARDVARGHTSVGPHGDDLALTLDAHPLRIAGSQGQQRAFVLALKLAEVTLARHVLGEPPVLLLDDVGSELDESRRAALFSYLEALEEAGGADDAQAQIVVTTTSLALLPPRADRAVMHIVAGRAARSVEAG